MSFEEFYQEFSIPDKEFVCDRLMPIPGRPTFAIFKSAGLMTSYGYLIFMVVVPAGTKQFRMHPGLINVVNCQDRPHTLTSSEIFELFPFDPENPQWAQDRQLLLQCEYGTFDGRNIYFYMKPRFESDGEVFIKRFSSVRRILLNIKNLDPYYGSTRYHNAYTLNFRYCTFNEPSPGSVQTFIDYSVGYSTPIPLEADDRPLVGAMKALPDNIVFELDERFTRLPLLLTPYSSNLCFPITSREHNVDLVKKLIDPLNSDLSLAEKLFRMSVSKQLNKNILFLLGNSDIDIFSSHSIFKTIQREKMYLPNHAEEYSQLLTYFNLDICPSKIIIVFCRLDMSGTPIYIYYQWDLEVFPHRCSILAGLALINFQTALVPLSAAPVPAACATS
jgi:hypothetical protein